MLEVFHFKIISLYKMWLLKTNCYLYHAVVVFYWLIVGILNNFDYNQMSENEHYRKRFEHSRGMHGN